MMNQTWEVLDKEIKEVEKGTLWCTRYWCSKCCRVHIYEPSVYRIGVEHLKYRVPFGETEVRCDGCRRKFKRKENALRPFILPIVDERLGVLSGRQAMAFFKWIIPPKILKKAFGNKRIAQLCDCCFKTYIRKRV